MYQGQPRTLVWTGRILVALSDRLQGVVCLACFLSCFFLLPLEGKKIKQISRKTERGRRFDIMSKACSIVYVDQCFPETLGFSKGGPTRYMR